MSHQDPFWQNHSHVTMLCLNLLILKKGTVTLELEGILWAWVCKAKLKGLLISPCIPWYPSAC